MDATTRRLIDYAMRTEFSNLPNEVVHECKRRLIDTLACVVGAYDAPLSQTTRAIAKRYTGTPSATVLGCSWQTTVEMAAFANGVMLRYLDMSDMYRGKNSGHPSDLIAPVLAVADALGAGGAAAINAITLAYDVYCSFCETIAIKSKGWDQPVYGVVASALGVAKLLGLNQEQMAQAVALALAPNMALAQTRRGELSNWKGCAGANASRNGIFAALLAQEGYTGPSAVFEGKGGLWDIVGPFEWQPAAGGDIPHRITKTNLKSFPVCYHGQSAVWAALDARKRLQVSEISEINVETYRRAIEEMANDPTRWAPTTHESADHSLPYAVAVALLEGEVTAASFSDEKLKDPIVADLMRKTKVNEDPGLSAQYPAWAPSRLTIRLATGEVVKVEVKSPKGDSTNPMDDKEVEAKFRSMYRGYGDEKQSRRILQSLWNFDRVQNVRDVLGLFVSRVNDSSGRND